MRMHTYRSNIINQNKTTMKNNKFDEDHEHDKVMNSMIGDLYPVFDKIIKPMNLTENEIIALKSITHSDFYENGRNSVCWDFSVYDDCPLRGKKQSGTFGSLGAKGLIEVTEKMKTTIINENGDKVRNPYYRRGEPNHGTVCISEDGYKLLDELNLIDEDGNFLND